MKPFLRPVLFCALLATGTLGLSACRTGTDTPPPVAEPPAAPAPTAPAPAAGGTDHEHASPHGGTVKTAGGGHLELVTEHTGFKVFVLDGSEKALPVQNIAGAQAIVQAEGGAATTIPLTPMDDHLHGVLPEGTLSYTAVVSVPVAGETRSAQFTVGLDSHATHAH